MHCGYLLRWQPAGGSVKVTPRCSARHQHSVLQCCRLLQDTTWGQARVAVGTAGAGHIVLVKVGRGAGRVAQYRTQQLCTHPPRGEVVRRW